MTESLGSIVLLSLYVSGVALAIASAVGVPLGAGLALYPIPGKRFIELAIYTGMGLPPVIVGVFVFLLLSQSGPLGWLNWLFKPSAMITAQTIIALPLVVGLTMQAVQSIDPALRLQVRALGATSSQVMRVMLNEARPGVIAAIAAAFGAAISEVGAVMLVGGDIEGRTRVLTTAVVLETRKGNFKSALALGGMLLGLALVSNFLLLRLRGRRSP